MSPAGWSSVLLSASCALTGCSGDEAASYQERRKAFRTVLVLQEASPGAPDTLPDLRPVFGDLSSGEFQLVTYPGPESELKAWVYLPIQPGGGAAPALMVLHAGWWLNPAYQTAFKPFMDAGYVVMWPTYRGEHGNPGHHERFFGEVEDAAAAARWLGAHPLVDGDHVYGLGWSAGGGIAALLSLWEDVPLRHTASSGGLYDPEFLRDRKDNPFDTTRQDELEMRVLPGNYHWMKRPHYAYLETQSERWIRSIATVKQANESGNTLIRVIMVPGDHFSIFPEVVQRYLGLIEQERLIEAGVPRESPGRHRGRGVPQGRARTIDTDTLT